MGVFSVAAMHRQIGMNDDVVEENQGQQQEDQNNSQEQAQPNTEGQAQATQASEGSEQNVQEQTGVDQNWARVRSVLQSQKDKIDQLERMVQENQKPPDKDEFDNVDGADYATVDMVKKPSKKVKNLEKEVGELKHKLQLNEASRQEELMRSKNDDYDYVIENFGLPLIEKNPALKQTLLQVPNWAEMAYNMAKGTPEYKKSQSNHRNNAKKVERVVKNTERPTSANAAGASLKSQAEVFANLKPSEVWKQSQEFARRA